MVDSPTLLAAVLLGTISFLSPCVLPLVPGYLSTITGFSLAEMEQRSRLAALIPALTFSLSFTLIFTLLGMTASSVGQALDDQRQLLGIISGSLVVVFGVAMIVAAWTTKLARTLHVGALLDNAGVSPLIAGAAFAVAWTPCLGPTLGAILGVAAQEDTVGRGGLLLAGYGVGLAIPFVLCALLLQRVIGPMRWFSRHHRAISTVSGLILIAFGVLLALDEVVTITSELTRILDDAGLGFFSNV